MKESIGGTWILGFVMLFIVLFAAYLAVSINYTKAFKAKNKLINLIEENEGFTASRYSNLDSISDDELKNAKTTEDKIYYYLRDTGYAASDTPAEKCFDKQPEFWHQGGYCVKKLCTRKGAYYRVQTFIKMELPIVNLKFIIPISGETKVIYRTQDDDLACSRDY